MRLGRCNWIRKFASTRAHNNLKSFLRSTSITFDRSLDQNFALLLYRNLSIAICVCYQLYIYYNSNYHCSNFFLNLYTTQFIVYLFITERTLIMRNYCTFFFASFHKILGTIYKCTFTLSSFPRYRRYVTMTNQWQINRGVSGVPLWWFCTSHCAF